jgi:nucleoside-diphosphate-sugar epimerase
MFQAAVAAGIKRVVFLSSQAWHGHYDKYGFTKVIGEELCEYYRRNHGIRYVAIRPADFTPWGDNFARYGARLLHGGVDREDVLDSIEAAIGKLGGEASGEAEGIVVNAVRPNAFSEAQIADWEADPVAACERIFPDSRTLIEKYNIDIKGKPGLSDVGEGAAQIGFEPTRHFGTFLDELRRLDAAGGGEMVKSKRCDY